MDRTGKAAHQQLIDEIRKALGNQTQRSALYAGTEGGAELAEKAYAGLPESDALLAKAREIKRKAIDQLDSNLVRFSQVAKSAGVEVHHVADADDAVRLVAKLARESNAKRIVKAKSMTTEEIELRKHLEREGFKVIETDLGERIIQLADQRPSHLVAPAIHMTVEEVATLFSRELNKEIPPDPEQITANARESLRQAFLEADVGITGANFAIADSGAIALVTNEGNARLVTALPRMMIAVFGVEKVVGSMADAVTLMQALIMSGAGRRMTSYVSIIKGGSVLAQDGETQRQHYVIVDNGRTEMRKDPDFREALYCLRCAACNDICPTFRILGGHVFGHIYTGPMAVPWTAFTTASDTAGSFAPLCITCGLCRKACPEDIDLPLLIARVKQEYAQRHGQLRINRVLSNYENFVKFASAASPIANFVLKRKAFRRMLQWLLGIDARRPFPRFARHTFTSWFDLHVSEGSRTVAYFVDTFANFCDPEIGKSVVGILEHNGFEVVMPKQVGSGIPAFLYGDVEKTRLAADFNVRHLVEVVRVGCEIVSSEPTATYCLKELYPRLLGSPEADLVAAHSQDLFEFLLDLHKKGELKTQLSNAAIEPAIYFSPCHTRSEYGESPAFQILQMIGVDTQKVRYDTCCGIAGTFGFKQGTEGYDVSTAIGETLFRRIKEMERRLVITESSVCKMQIEHGTKLEVVHPATLLWKLCEEETA